MITIDRLDHLVLTVSDLAVTCDFYTDVLGMEIIIFAGGRHALVFGQQKINLHVAGRNIEPKAAVPTPGSADLCFISATPLDEVVAHLTANKVDILQGPVQRTGALGLMMSVYFRDPDGNLLEVSNYLPQ